MCVYGVAKLPIRAHWKPICPKTHHIHSFPLVFPPAPPVVFVLASFTGWLHIIYIYIYTHTLYMRTYLLVGRKAMAGYMYIHTYIATYFSMLQSSYSCCQQRGVLPLWMFVGRVGGKYSLHPGGRTCVLHAVHTPHVL